MSMLLLAKYSAIALAFMAVLWFGMHLQFRILFARRPGRRSSKGRGAAAMRLENLPNLPWVVALIAGLLGLLLGPLRMADPQTYLLPAALAGIGYALPGMVRRYRQHQQRLKFEQGLPESLELIANSLRAGLSLAQAMEAAAQEGEPVLVREFQEAVRNGRLGVGPVEALEKMAQRWQNPDLELFTVAAGVSARTGANLAEMAGRIIETIRERVKLQGRIRTLTSQGRLSGWVVGLLPLVLLLGMFYLDPDLIRGFLRHPLGWAMLAAGLVMELVGALIIRKIVAIDA